MIAATSLPAADDDAEMVDDSTMGRAGVAGLTIGALVMIAVVFGIGLLAGLDPGVSAVVAVGPGVVAGLFFGMTAYLGIHLARQEHAGH
jgi:hypothetical protein